MPDVQSVKQGVRETFHVPQFVHVKHAARGAYRHGVCAGCGGVRDRGPRQAYCKTCHAAYARAHRPKHSELSPEAKQRANCRAHTKMLVKRGQLTKTPCACGSREVTAVHTDYTNPRAVIWRCTVCRAGGRHVVAA